MDLKFKVLGTISENPCIYTSCAETPWPNAMYLGGVCMSVRGATETNFAQGDAARERAKLRRFIRPPFRAWSAAAALACSNNICKTQKITENFSEHGEQGFY
jgi:hypothetical protein